MEEMGHNMCVCVWPEVDIMRFVNVSLEDCRCVSGCKLRVNLNLVSV